MTKACLLLKIDPEDIKDYFFTFEVQEMWTNPKGRIERSANERTFNKNFIWA